MNKKELESMVCSLGLRCNRLDHTSERLERIADTQTTRFRESKAKIEGLEEQLRALNLTINAYKDGSFNLNDRLHDLQGQTLCGYRGHAWTLSKRSELGKAAASGYIYTFRCAECGAECGAEYGRHEDDLTAHERRLVDAVYGEVPAKETTDDSKQAS